MLKAWPEGRSELTGRSGLSYASVAGDREHESAVDEEPDGYGAEHVRAEGLMLDGFQRGAEATGLARVRLIHGKKEESAGDGDGAVAVPMRPA